jgi:hypothetical protein
MCIFSIISLSTASPLMPPVCVGTEAVKDGKHCAGPDSPIRPHKFGGGALVASGILFVVLDFRAGPPPSNGAEILLWRDSQELVLDFVSEFLFFATVLLVPGTVALYQSLVEVDRTKAATGCGIIAATIPVVAVILIVHGRLVYPV